MLNLHRTETQILVKPEKYLNELVWFSKNFHLPALLAVPYEQVSLIGEQTPLSHTMFWLFSMEFKVLRDLIGPAKSMA